MARRLFRRYVQTWLTGQAIDLTTADLRVVGVNAAEHAADTTIAGDEFLADIPAAARESVTAALQNVTVVDGTLDADDLALPDLGGADPVSDLRLYAHTGNDATARLLAIIDDAPGLPLTPDSVEDEIQWDPDGILSIIG